MKIIVYFNPENMKQFRAKSMDTMYFSYTRTEKYYVTLQLDIDSDYKYEFDFQPDLVLVKVRPGR